MLREEYEKAMRNSKSWEEDKAIINRDMSTRSTIWGEFLVFDLAEYSEKSQTEGRLVPSDFNLEHKPGSVYHKSPCLDGLGWFVNAKCDHLQTQDLTLFGHCTACMQPVYCETKSNKEKRLQEHRRLMTHRKDLAILSKFFE